MERPDNRRQFVHTGKHRMERPGNRHQFTHTGKFRTKSARRRRPSEGGMPALVEPPRGPRPLLDGAAAPLEFDS